MTPLDTLAPDQRAVLELVLRQGRSYGELSELLAIPDRDVRARADAGLRALAGAAGPGVDTGRIADWLLGQQPEAEAERTRSAVARNAAAREWAATAAERLRELGGAAVPEVPAGEDAPRARPRPLRDDAPPPAARPRPVREEPSASPAAALRSSKLGGAVLIAVLVLVVGGLIAFVVTRGSSDNAGKPPAAASNGQPTATATATASSNDILLRGTGGAAGLMRLVRGSDGKVRFAIAAEKVPANKGREVYAVWFTKSGAKPRRLGFAQTQVGSDGVLTTGGPQKRDESAFPTWFATYEKVLVTRETTAKATKPGPVVLEGALPAGGG